MKSSPFLLKNFEIATIVNDIKTMSREYFTTIFVWGHSSYVHIVIFVSHTRMGTISAFGAHRMVRLVIPQVTNVTMETVISIILLSMYSIC